MARFKINTDQLPADKDLRLTADDRSTGGLYSWEKRIAVVTKYLALGNARLVSELEDVPYGTLMYWKNSEPWWPQLVEEIKKSRQAETNTKLNKIIDKSLEVIQDRIENGDIRIAKDKNTGELLPTRVPVSLKDATKAASDLMDKQIKIEELSNKFEIQRESVQETLNLLAMEFAKWAKGQSKNNAEDIKFNDITVGRLPTGTPSVVEVGGDEEERPETSYSTTDSGRED